MSEFNIEFEPVGRRGKCAAGKFILDAARELGVGINNVCGGQGTCHTCKIKVLSGAVSKATSHEIEALTPDELEQGWRLACQAFPEADARVHVPPESMTTPQRVQVEGFEVAATFEPAVRTYTVRVSPPTLDDPQADADRLLEALQQQHKVKVTRIDIAVLRNLPSRLRASQWQAQASVRGNELVAVNGPARRPLGLAVDLGSTKIAGYLVDFTDGHMLASKGAMNPQISYGEDIISRISYAIKSPAESRKLQEITVAAIGQLAAEMCAEAGAIQEDIVEAVVVGNTAMHHFFLDLPVLQLAHSPFVPAVNSALDVKARDSGLAMADGAYVHLLPNIAGFVGADHVAMLLAIEALKQKEVTIAIDIGTNTEVSLIDRGKMTCVSCASGPTFEGAHIKDGMRATAGAIERLQIAGNKVNYQTIDNQPPVGICGSGIIDAVAQLYITGVLDKNGRMKEGHLRVRTTGQQREFVLVDEKDEGRAVTVTQHDVREIQLAKAAIRSGINLLLAAGHRTEKEIERVIIAGAFGSYIDVGSAVTMGLLPPLPLERFRQVGNAAGMGARLALTSLRRRAEAQKLAQKVSYLELANDPAFKTTFVEASYIGKYWLAGGKREEIA